MTRSASSRVRTSTGPAGAYGCIYTELIHTPMQMGACRASPSAFRDKATSFNLILLPFLMDLRRPRALRSKSALFNEMTTLLILNERSDSRAWTVYSKVTLNPLVPSKTKSARFPLRSIMYINYSDRSYPRSTHTTPSATSRTSGSPPDPSPARSPWHPNPAP